MTSHFEVALGSRFQVGDVFSVPGRGRWRVRRVCSPMMVEATPVTHGEGIIWAVCVTLTLGMLGCFGYGLYKIFF